MFCLVAVSDDSQEATSSRMDRPGDPGQPWLELAPDYERARTREESLDRLVEWPAQRELLGDVAGRSVLDLGCGNGGKLAELVLQVEAQCPLPDEARHAHEARVTQVAHRIDHRTPERHAR